MSHVKMNKRPLSWRLFHCRSSHGLIERYVAGTLAPSKTQSLERHLDACDTCHEAYEALFAVRCVLDVYPRIKASPDFDRRVLSTLDNYLEEKHAPTSRTLFERLDPIVARPVHKLVWSCVVAVVLLTIGAVLLPRLLSPSQSSAVVERSRAPKDSVNANVLDGSPPLEHLKGRDAVILRKPPATEESPSHRGILRVAPLPSE